MCSTTVDDKILIVETHIFETLTSNRRDVADRVPIDPIGPRRLQ
jgi:hypothetical protein